MPIYEYRCADCGEVSELLVGIGRNSDDLTCRSCGGKRLEKMMSAASFSTSYVAPSAPPPSTCCGSNPSETGCVPGSCCGSK
jgi:putative FmdB family regulatory protein